MRFHSLIIGVLAFLMTPPAWADLTIRGTSRVFEKGKLISSSKTACFVTPTAFRSDSSQDGKPALSMVVAPKRILMMDSSKKQSLEITDEDLVLAAELSKLAGDALDQPSDFKTADNLTFRKKGTQKKIGTFSCTDYEAKNNTKTIMDLCIVPWGSHGVFRADFKVLEGLRARSKQLMNDLFSKAPSLDQLPGYPIQSRIYFNELNQIIEAVTESIETKSLSPAVFTAPIGYQIIRFHDQLVQTLNTFRQLGEDVPEIPGKKKLQ